MENRLESFAVIVSSKAKQMLVEHSAFLAEVSLDAALRLADEFEKAALSLESLPFRCPWLKNEYIPANKYRFLVFEKYYMLLYQVVDKNVYVDYVLDCRQDYGWLLR